MKKMAFILMAVLALSIVVFGFSDGRSAVAVNINPAKHAVRFNIEQTVPAGVKLPARIRVISNTTGVLAYDSVTRLTLKANKYISEPILLGQGSYRVEAIATMPDGERKSYRNPHELVLNRIPLDFH